jgi:hypothetical protein
MMFRLLMIALVLFPLVVAAVTAIPPAWYEDDEP